MFSDPRSLWSSCPKRWTDCQHSMLDMQPFADGALNLNCCMEWRKQIHMRRRDRTLRSWRAFSAGPASGGTPWNGIQDVRYVLYLHGNPVTKTSGCTNNWLSEINTLQHFSLMLQKITSAFSSMDDTTWLQEMRNLQSLRMGFNEGSWQLSLQLPRVRWVSDARGKANAFCQWFLRSSLPTLLAFAIENPLFSLPA